MNEITFETHIADTLKASGWDQITNVVPTRTFVNGPEFAAYLARIRAEEPTLQTIAPEKLLASVMALLEADWKAGVPTATLLKKGVTLIDPHFRIHLVDPAKPENNRWTFQTQFQHDLSNQDRKIDLMLWVNGLPLAPIEVKNQQTGQDARDAVEQLLKRSTTGQCPTLFHNGLFSAAVSTQNVFLSISDNPKTEKDFRHFDPSDGYTPPTGEFNTHHFYGEFLQPKNLTELIHKFLYEETKDGKKKLIFPRFHQWECVRLVCEEIQESIKDTELGDEFLLQHSAGSGKSKTIAWLCQFIGKGFFIPGTQEPIFSKVLVITDRKDLDQQLQRDLQPILGDHSVTQAQNKNHLGELLAATLPPVITSTVQKFLDFDKALWPRDKRIAIIIDEAHRSQNGAYNEEMRKSVQALPPIAEDMVFVGDELFNQIADKNTVLIALTATPTEETLNKFGKEITTDGKTKKVPHHLYSMRQAIAEGYIINVAKNVVTYDTLYQLHQTGASIPLLDTYPPGFLSRTLTWAAYESEEIIEEKASIIAAMIRSKTMHAIGGKGRAMLTCISRKAASIYQRKLKELLKDYDISPLVAYTDSGDDIAKFGQLNAGVGAHAKNDEELKTIFRNEDRYRILVVASKFQTGFDETLLHTLFLDKPVKGINAVQTLSRLNRTHEGKEDTLIVDFTNSYEEIAKAFGQFLGQSEAWGVQCRSLQELTDAFAKLCAGSATSPEEWTPTDTSHANLDKICCSLSKRVKEKSQTQNVLDILNFFFDKSLLCNQLDWATRKDVLRGVLGYLSTSTGKYSVVELRDSVTAIGLATKLIHIGSKAIEPTKPQDNTGAGGGGKPKEVTMAEAISKINRDNLLKLQRYIQELQSKETNFLNELPQEVRNALKEFRDACNDTFKKCSDAEDIREIILEHHRAEHSKLLDALFNWNAELAGPTTQQFLEINQIKEQLAKIECRFYTSQTTMREAMHQNLEDSVAVEAALNLLKKIAAPKATVQKAIIPNATEPLAHHHHRD